MIRTVSYYRSVAAACALACALVCALVAGCGSGKPANLQGYVEGEYVYVASPYAGALTKLNVQRGMQVKTGTLLFALDEQPQLEARNEAERRLAMAQSNLEDVRKGKRPTEISSLEAQLAKEQAGVSYAERELVRQERLTKTGSAQERDLDLARSSLDQGRQRVLQLEADLKTARLGAREDQIEAAAAEVNARKAALSQASWELKQKSQPAAQAGFVFDTLYREGEWVAAGKPVVVLLPPENIKVRTFVPQALVGTIQLGDPIHVHIDGRSQPLAGKVTYISPKAEFTPPVIYSRESRSKLVFMVEAQFEPEIAKLLHPGEPLEVSLDH